MFELENNTTFYGQHLKHVLIWKFKICHHRKHHSFCRTYSLAKYISLLLYNTACVSLWSVTVGTSCRYVAVRPSRRLPRSNTRYRQKPRPVLPWKYGKQRIGVGIHVRMTSQIRYDDYFIIQSQEAAFKIKLDCCENLWRSAIRRTARQRQRHERRRRGRAAAWFGREEETEVAGAVLSVGFSVRFRADSVPKPGCSAEDLGLDLSPEVRGNGDGLGSSRSMLQRRCS